MPEIKNTFLAGKMNKSLDDRLLPEGEYRDALNIQVTKSEGSDVGAVQNLKGNTQKTFLDLHSSAKVIGSCFDDQNNTIYWFVHQGLDRTVVATSKTTNIIYLDNANGVNPGDFLYTKDPIQGALDILEVATVDYENETITVLHDQGGSYGNIIPSITILSGTIITFGTSNFITSKILKYNKTTDESSEVLSDNVLGFKSDSVIQANIIENYLFYTDGINEPKKIDTTKTYTNLQESDITVAKLAPQRAPLVEVLTTESNAGNYIEKKFVRFAYRYKYSDNTYSVYSPFSNIVFSLDSNVLTEDQIQEAYSSGELSFFTNKAKTISITPRSPGGAVGIFASEYDIVQIDILMKSSDSPAVMLLDSIKVEGTEYIGAFTYNSEKPKNNTS